MALFDLNIMTTSKKYLLLSSAACLFFGILMVFIAYLAFPQPAKAAGVCQQSSDCGTSRLLGEKFCQGNNIYQNVKKYVCVNPGASSSCFSSNAAQSVGFCAYGQTCSGGSCVANPNNPNNPNTPNNPTNGGACYQNADCGTNGFVGGPFCQGNTIYKNYKTYICQNPGKNSTCFSSSTPKYSQFCGTGKTCSNGACVNLPITCSCNADCGPTELVGNRFCQGNSVYKNTKTFTCQNPGTSNSKCVSSSYPKLQENCSPYKTCINGGCVLMPI